jgi:short-subunit dehydrogenase
MNLTFFGMAITILSILFSTYFVVQKIEIKTALITGASRGISLSLMKELLKEDVNVIAVVRDRKILETLFKKYHIHWHPETVSSPY